MDTSLRELSDVLRASPRSPSLSRQPLERTTRAEVTSAGASGFPARGLGETGCRRAGCQSPLCSDWPDPGGGSPWLGERISWGSRQIDQADERAYEQRILR